MFEPFYELGRVTSVTSREMERLFDMFLEWNAPKSNNWLKMHGLPMRRKLRKRG